MNNETHTHEMNNAHKNDPLRNISPSMKKVGLGVIAVLVIFIALLGISSQSLPGDGLYGIKTQVLERLGASVRFGTQNEANYVIKNMETRLAETKELSKLDNVSEEALTALHQRIIKHSEVLTALVQEESNDFSMEDRLFTLDTFASLTGAIEIIAENDTELVTLGDQAEDVRRDTVNLYKDTADMFVQSGVIDKVLEFIKTSLSQTSERLGDASISEETIDDAEEYIYRASIAISDNEYAKAIYAVGEASRFIKMESYTGIVLPLITTETETASSTTEIQETSTTTATTSASTSPAL